jgi:hypothetical protein
MWEQPRGDDRGQLENQPLFELGQLLMTSGVAELVQQEGLDPIPFIIRHGKGNWGDLDAEDLRANEIALNTGSRLFSSYNLSNNRKLWVITEWDRSCTTLLLPNEY